MICVKSVSACSLRINRFYVVKKVLKGAYFLQNAILCFLAFKIPYAKTYCYDSFSVVVFM